MTSCKTTLLKAWTGLPSFRWQSQLYTWLVCIATNEVLTFLKKAKSLQQIPLEDRLDADLSFSTGGRYAKGFAESHFMSLPPTTPGI
jgi:DNA-directed RNA polymerase specialized sigma24 family protein